MRLISCWGTGWCPGHGEPARDEEAAVGAHGTGDADAAGGGLACSRQGGGKHPGTEDGRDRPVGRAVADARAGEEHEERAEEEREALGLQALDRSQGAPGEDDERRDGHSCATESVRDDASERSGQGADEGTDEGQSERCCRELGPEQRRERTGIPD